MKTKICFVISLAITTLLIQSEPELSGKSFFNPRAQHTNAARDLTVWYPYANYETICNQNLIHTHSLSYNQSVRPLRIARALFSTDTLTISGSQISERENDDNLLADYFGLSPDFEGSIFFKPRIKNILFNSGFLYNLYNFCDGLFVRVELPIAWTKWDLVLKETVENAGLTTPFPAGYMSEDPLNAPRQSFTQAVKSSEGFGQVQPLKFGKIDGGQSKTTVAQLYAELGFYVCATEDQQAEIHFSLSAPTGNRAHAEYLFEPLVGNGKHWQVGIGGSVQTIVWQREPDQDLTIYALANFTHLCKARQTRSFDLIDNGFLSRYALLKVFENGVPTGEIIPAINATTLSCKVHSNIQVDVALMFGYRHGDLLLNAGYNGWMKSKEKISHLQEIPEKTYGLKGIQNIVAPDTNQIDSTTQSNATIFGNLFEDQEILGDELTQYISTKDINLKSAATQFQLTHKIFVDIAHQWEWQCYQSSIDSAIGVGVEIEFEGINEHNTAQPDKTTMGQWGLWLHGTVSF